MPTTVWARHKKRYTWSAVSTFAQAHGRGDTAEEAGPYFVEGYGAGVASEQGLDLFVCYGWRDGLSAHGLATCVVAVRAKIAHGTGRSPSTYANAAQNDGRRRTSE
jgi:hypothetical protein